MQASSTSTSFLSPLGYQSGDCGYCKNEETSASYYAKTRTLSPEHYQNLVDRGWRRSGTLLYLPDAARSCCPHYTIRLAAADLKPTRDQRQALHRWNRYVLGDEYGRRYKQKNPRSKVEKKRSNTTFDLTTAVHESEIENVQLDLDPSHKFEVTLDHDTFTQEKFALFDDYQRHVHHETPDEVTEAGFKRFLCGSPLQRREQTNGKPLGSFHQCYRLDGRLVAMGVLDLLPHAVSAVYFIYHRDFEKWSFGKLSALREAALAHDQGYQFYYMGYYIHGCRKMRYKSDFKPQYVLDYNGFGWDPMDAQMTDLMEQRKYASMSVERHRQAAAKPAQSHENGSETASTEVGDGFKFLNPLDAMESRLSLFELGMPGFTPLDQLQHEINLDRLKIYLNKNTVVFAHHITVWDSGSETEPTSIKGVVAEFAAALGPKLAKEVLIDFSR